MGGMVPAGDPPPAVSSTCCIQQHQERKKAQEADEVHQAQRTLHQVEHKRQSEKDQGSTSWAAMMAFCTAGVNPWATLSLHAGVCHRRCCASLLYCVMSAR